MKYLNATLVLFSACAAVAAGVHMEESKITLPTAKTGEVASATYLTMENDWLRFGVLPEQGGCLFNLTEKQTGREVIRGCAGAEKPVDWKLVRNKRTREQAIWVGETEPSRRLKWSVGRFLLSDRAVMQAECVVMNRGRYVEPMFTGADGLALPPIDAGAKDAGYELAVGRLGDGGTGDDWIGPCETRTVRWFCFPVKGIGGVKRATIDGAVNVARRADREEMQVGFHSTRPLTGCTIEVRRGNETVFAEQNVTIAPNMPWCKVVKVLPDAEDREFTATLTDAAGKVVLAYTPGAASAPPTKAEGPRESEEAARAKQSYLRACGLEEEGLATVDSAVRAAKFKEAGELYRQVSGSAAWGRPASAALARLACLRGDWKEALARVDDALAYGDREAKLHVLRAYILRQQKQLTACSKELRLAAMIDPLDAWGVAERAFLEDDGADAVLNAGENRGRKREALLETVSDYWSIGAWREVAVLCDQANLFALKEKASRTDGRGADYACALFDYFGGFALEMMGYPDLAKARYAKAAAQPADSCRPTRREESAVMKRAAVLREATSSER
ncbi:MAG: hypothetical protein ACI4RA_01730 [Kiritimatiellia bacterium]